MRKPIRLSKASPGFGHRRRVFGRTALPILFTRGAPSFSHSRCAHGWRSLRPAGMRPGMIGSRQARPPGWATAMPSPTCAPAQAEGPATQPGGKPNLQAKEDRLRARPDSPGEGGGLPAPGGPGVDRVGERDEGGSRIPSSAFWGASKHVPDVFGMRQGEKGEGDPFGRALAEWRWAAARCRQGT
jgi:hypothetical protein